MRNVEKHEEKVVIGGGPNTEPPYENFGLPWPFGERPPKGGEKVIDPNG